MDYLLGKVYTEDVKEHIKVKAKKDIRIKDGMFVFRKDQIYDAIRDQHNNLCIKAYGRDFNFKSDISTIYFKKLNKCQCGKYTTDLFCDKCKAILFWSDVNYDSEFN